MPAPRATLPALLAALALLAVPAAAGAAEVAVVDVVTNTPCARYVPGQQTVRIAAAGFTPGALVTVRAGDQALASGPADPGGTFATTARPPAPPTGRASADFPITASDDRGVAAPPRNLAVTRLEVTLPRRARPSSRVLYRARGFLPDRVVYLHVRRGGRTLARFSLGRARGNCGNATRRLRYMPLRRYRSGQYEYAFGHARRYRRSTTIYGLSLLITRRGAPR
jgi:hypothetical protein